MLQITLLKSLFLDTVFAGVAQTWSLTVEEVFYLSAAFIFILARRGKLMLVLGLTYIFTGLVFAFDQAFSILGYAHDPTLAFRTQYFGYVFALFTGIYASRHILSHLPHSATDLALKTYLGLTGMLGSIFLLALFHQPAGPPTVELTATRLFIYQYLLPVFTALFLYALVVEQSLCKRFLSSGLMTLFGHSSYAFYLIHVGIIQWWVHALSMRLVSPTTSPFVLLLADFLILNSVALLL